MLYINYFSYQLNILFTIFLSPSPSKAAPKSYGPFFIAFTKSLAYVKFGSGWSPPKSSNGVALTILESLTPNSWLNIRFTYGPVTRNY